MLKLARGHTAFELSDLHLEPPDHFMCAPLTTLQADESAAFLWPLNGDRARWPEIGSRAFHRASGALTQEGPWQVVQPGRYRYLVDQGGGVMVQFLLSEYLACRVIWE